MKRRSTGASRLDDFANIFAGSLTESAAGTLTFSNKLEMGYSLGDNVGLILHRIDYHIPHANMEYLLDNGDYVQWGLATSNQISSPGFSGSNQIDYRELQRHKYGTAASGWDMTQPIASSDFTNLPAGGVLIAPNPLYFHLKGVSLASPMTIYWRMYFTAVTLNDKGFREMWETWNSLRV